MHLAVYHNLPSGGAKRTLHEAVKRLAARHRTDVYTLGSANHGFADVRPHVAHHRVFDFRPLPLLSSPLGRLNQAIRLADLLRLRLLASNVAREIERQAYDLALVYSCRFENSPSILKKLLHLPSVYYCQEPVRRLYEAMPARPYDDDHTQRRARLNRVDPLPAVYDGILRRVDRRNLRSASAVLVNSQFSRRTLRGIYGVDPSVSYHGVDTEQFRPLGGVEKHPIVLSVGSLTALKGFDFLIEGLARIPSQRRPGLVIASNFQDPFEKAYLECLACERDVSLSLRGNVTDEQLLQLYNQAAVVVYSPVREPFGLVPLEAMACGTPVVGVREGGVAETIVDGHTGFLVERDPMQFAEAVSRLLSDPSLAGEFGRNGREHVVRHWRWECATTTLEAHLAALSKIPASPLQE